jgi:hypothetical protein
MPSLHGQAPGATENNTYRGRRLGLRLLLPINVVEVQSDELIIPSSHSNCHNHPDRARDQYPLRKSVTDLHGAPFRFSRRIDLERFVKNMKK